jgi:diphthamide biosynthesis methyltransferase
MTSTNINNVSDLMIQAADALRRCDIIKLEELRNICDEWMQTQQENLAQREMIAAMIEAVEQIAEM